MCVFMGVGIVLMYSTVRLSTNPSQKLVQTPIFSIVPQKPWKSKAPRAVYAHEDSLLVCIPWYMRAHTPHVSVWLSQHTIHHGMHTNAQ